jgi:hypothetical protein
MNMFKLNLQTTGHALTTPRHQALLAVVLLSLAGCQSAPPVVVKHHPPLPTTTSKPTPTSPAKPTTSTTAQPEFGYPPLQPQTLPAAPPTPAQPQVNLRDGRDIPLVQSLMNQGVQQLQQGQYDNAEETFDRVQRIAPQYSSVYARLSEVALRKKDGASAEGMARRGLVFAKSAPQRQGFWQLILLAGTMQNNADVVNEAKAHLQMQ